MNVLDMTPCPICGKTPTILKYNGDHWVVSWKKDCLCNSINQSFPTEDLTVTAWNTEVKQHEQL